MKCDKCDGAFRGAGIEKHEVNRELFGGMRVILVNGAAQKMTCDMCGHVRIDIPDPEGLTAAVVKARALMPLKLNGREIKFMRKAMEMPAKELASKLDVSEETISRWESQQAIGGANEKLFRYVACKTLNDDAPAIPWTMEQIINLDIRARLGTAEVSLYFERTKLVVETAIKPVWAEEPKLAA